MALRNRLHINKIEDFKSWLVQDGWELVDVKGYYEVLRAKKAKRTLIVYKKLDAKEHVSVQDKDSGVLGAYFRDRKKGKNETY